MRGDTESEIELSAPEPGDPLCGTGPVDPLRADETPPDPGHQCHGAAGPATGFLSPADREFLKSGHEERA